MRIGSGAIALFSLMLAIEYRVGPVAMILISLSAISPLITYNFLVDTNSARPDVEL